MIKIAICDDELSEFEHVNNLLKQYTNVHPQYQIDTYYFSAPFQLLAHMEAISEFDVLLLDIYMPGILGTEVARELRDKDDNCEIVFLTSSRDHAIDAFSLGATHYLVKPYLEKQFFAAFDKVIENLDKKEGECFTVKSTDGIIRINLNTLIYSESNNHLQHLYLSDGRTIGVRKSSSELFELIEEEPRFYKGGNTYIINMDYIAELSPKNVIFSNGAKILMLSRKYSDLKKRYMDYYSRR